MQSPEIKFCVHHNNIAIKKKNFSTKIREVSRKRLFLLPRPTSEMNSLYTKSKNLTIQQNAAAAPNYYSVHLLANVYACTTSRLPASNTIWLSTNISSRIT
jgi:hypothetical protein